MIVTLHSVNILIFVKIKGKGDIEKIVKGVKVAVWIVAERPGGGMNDALRWHSAAA